MNATTPTTATANQELSAARGGLAQCRYSLRAAKRILDAYPSTPQGIETLIDAIDALSVSVESLAKVVEAQVKP
jgi:hypothetical protein